MQNCLSMLKVDPQVVEIQERAQAASLDMARVLADAGVAASTWYRWREGKVGPNLSTLRRVQGALEKHLERAG